MTVLKDIEKGNYKRTMVANPEATEDDMRPTVPLVPGSGEVVEVDHVIRSVVM